MTSSISDDKGIIKPKINLKKPQVPTNDTLIIKNNPPKKLLQLKVNNKYIIQSKINSIIKIKTKLKLKNINNLQQSSQDQSDGTYALPMSNRNVDDSSKCTTYGCNQLATLYDGQTCRLVRCHWHKQNGDYKIRYQ